MLKKLLFQGDEFNLQVIENAGKHTKVSLIGENILVRVNQCIPIGAREDEIRKKIGQFYRRMARDTILERLEYYKTRLGVNYAQVRIKEQKTRWGSCSGKGNLNFNWKLVMAPSDIIDYVVVHELCHLVHMNHSHNFWKLVERELPDYRARKRWLRDHGAALRF